MFLRRPDLFRQKSAMRAQGARNGPNNDVSDVIRGNQRSGH